MAASLSAPAMLALALAVTLGSLGCDDEAGIPGATTAASGGAGGAGAASQGGAGGGGGGADAMPGDATRAIRNKYFGCDPNAPQACGPDAHPDPGYDASAEALMRERLGRPTTPDLEAHWCLNAEASAPASDGGCRHYAKDAAGKDLPEAMETAPPSHGQGQRAFSATFERGVLVAHLESDAWRVHEVFDEASADPENDEPAPFVTFYARTLDPPGTASFLGVPDSSPVADVATPSQTFVNGPCRYTVSFDAAALRFAVALDGGGAECAVPPGFDQVDAVSFEVNANRLRAREERAVRFIAERVVPRLEGSRAEKLRVAGRVSWWTLKEGVLMLEAPIPYSNCHNDSAGTDSHIGPLEICNTNIAWQVGIAGVQVIYNDPATVAAASGTFFPGASVAAVLEGTAWDAFPADPTTRAAIEASTGELQHSWLLRNPVLGVVFEEPPVSNECIVQAKGWCFGCGWTTSCRYAPSKAAALGAMEDLCRALNALAPLAVGESRADYAGGCSG